MSQQNENVVSLADFRKKKQEKKKEFPPALTFEPGKYYIYPELGVMVHCILLTDKFHTQKDPVYIMEDQFGNIFGEQMVEGVTVGWHDLSPDVFIQTAEKLSKDNEPEPPRAV